MSNPALPPILFLRSRPVALRLALVGVPAFAVGLLIAVTLGEDLDAGDVIAVAAFNTAVLSMTLGGVLWVLARSQRRSREQCLAEAPPTAVFASPSRACEVQSADHPKRVTRFEGWATGLLVISSEGVTYTRTKPTQTFTETRLTWGEIERVELKRESSIRGMLRVWTGTRQVLTWQVPGAADLEAALEQLQQGG